MALRPLHTYTDADIDAMTEPELDEFIAAFGNDQKHRSMDLAHQHGAQTDEELLADWNRHLGEAYGDVDLSTWHGDDGTGPTVLDLSNPEQAKAFTELVDDPETFDLANPEDVKRFERYCKETGTDPNSLPRFDVTNTDLSNVNPADAMTEDELLARWDQDQR